MWIDDKFEVVMRIDDKFEVAMWVADGKFVEVVMKNFR